MISTNMPQWPAMQAAAEADIQLCKTLQRVYFGLGSGVTIKDVATWASKMVQDEHRAALLIQDVPAFETFTLRMATAGINAFIECTFLTYMNVEHQGPNHPDACPLAHEKKRIDYWRTLEGCPVLISSVEYDSLQLAEAIARQQYAGTSAPEYYVEHAGLSAPEAATTGLWRVFAKSKPGR